MPQKEKKVLVAYDIVSNKRRLKVAHCLEDHGLRINKSVFVCTLTPEYSLTDLEAEIRSLISHRDHIFFLPLCRKCYEAAWSFGGEHIPDSRRKRRTKIVCSFSSRKSSNGTS